MSGIEDLKATRKALRDMSRVVTFTRKTLAKMVREEERLGMVSAESQPGQLFEALEHLGEVREGFILSQRTTPQTALSDIRELVRHILIDWQWVHNLNLTLSPGDTVEFCPDGCFVTLPNGDREALTGAETLEIVNGRAVYK